jgi:glycosyltransferase involved in cell wall biosynthesis
MLRNLSVTVVCATYGDPSWQRLAETRAIPSARQQGVLVIAVHSDNLINARNEGLMQVGTEFIIFLDADDELSPGYIDAMAAGTADLRVPQVAYIHPGVVATARFPRVGGHQHDCTGDCLSDGNWMVIGVCARTQILRDVGGFRDWAWSEDWDLWYRCHLAGATIEPIPEAVYRAHVRAESRNRGQSDQATKDACFWGIRRSCQEWAAGR